jgi:hypothetical protein
MIDGRSRARGRSEWDHDAAGVGVAPHDDMTSASAHLDEPALL